VKTSLPRVLTAILAVLASIVLVTPAQAAPANPYERGPAPTLASITAERGPFTVASVTVPSGSGPGFKQGTIYYPADTTQGTFGAVVVMPGFVGTQSTIAWYGPRLASQGFVVMTVDTVSLLDFPSDRSKQQLAALTYLTGRSAVKDRVDPGRLAVMGWSMGGGGSLESAASMPSLKAAIPLAPWDSTNPVAGITTPTLVFGADGDTVAPVATYALPFYNGLTRARDKAFVELRGADHSTFGRPHTTVAQYSISWLKRFVDDDTRYSQFLCPVPNDPNTVVLEVSCPL